MYTHAFTSRACVHFVVADTQPTSLYRRPAGHSLLPPTPGSEGFVCFWDFRQLASSGGQAQACGPVGRVQPDGLTVCKVAACRSPGCSSLAAVSTASGALIHLSFLLY